MFVPRYSRHNVAWSRLGVHPVRTLTKFSLKPKKSLAEKEEKRSVHPTSPARTRFAPSPTGHLHLGSLRTALYNYLLAKSTGGEFLLRLEDTDQKRLVPGAEKNIYESLEWCGLEVTEGPMTKAQPYGPYRQSDRADIYRQYSSKLLDSGHAYRCFCPKERLDSLRESAAKIQPPTNASYDRHCSHILAEASRARAEKESFTIRLKAPEVYPPFEDLLHGKLNLQPQVNLNDRRYDDPVLVKSDGLPTYHLANVIDDSLMKITHVVRGEEWLPSTPKHIAIYSALGWKPPQFVHIPLLTSTADKKLSKRSGDTGVWTMKQRGVLPEALVNFAALFGWAPVKASAKGVSVSEILSLEEMAKVFSLDDLTKGNAKVDDKKLNFFNKYYLGCRLKNPTQLLVLVEEYFAEYLKLYPNFTKAKFSTVLAKAGPSLTFVPELKGHAYLFTEPDLAGPEAIEFLQKHDILTVLRVLTLLVKYNCFNDFNSAVAEVLEKDGSVNKKYVFESFRYAVSGSIPGVKIPHLMEIMGEETVNQRLTAAIRMLGG
ncbi:hypothetical protein BABINDRAFT_162227 [Babjeviella inositovora NRRL Y-12698]|uniref:Glutamate--tRNA ligase, mitochondrial n=1 Tax=Babjeviella inositovora NRRL Y-12698 TaxID=984486 RepID=A0A1E3QNC0_9ASCO|nr:uncharacterized protein BABINDRAFT_162227 [Babjeviella inositovora NRRL Y-12698]ODQ79185.1 hypothetical protein BABINDRAFT_162227 [Babjeviella inositovora NRRL Y-12698]